MILERIASDMVEMFSEIWQSGFNDAGDEGGRKREMCVQFYSQLSHEQKHKLRFSALPERMLS